MKIKFILGACAIALLTACGGGNNSSESEDKPFDPKPYNDSLANFIKDNKTKLDSLLLTMETFAKDVEAGKYKINNKLKFEDTLLNFRPIALDYKNYSSPNSTYNAIHITDNAILGKPLPENMPEDFYAPMYFSDFKELMKTGKVDHKDYSGPQLGEQIHNDRIVLQSYLNTRYVVYLKLDKYTKGSVSIILNEYEAPVLEGIIYVYDLKKKKFCGAGDYYVRGPQDLSYKYKENDMSDEQYQAENAMNSTTPDSIRIKTMRLLKDFVNIDESSLD